MGTLMSLLTFLIFQGASAVAADAAQIVLPGTYHGDELALPAQSERWLGLYEDDGGLSWKYTSPAFRPAEDPVLDRPGEQTGVEVAVPGEQPLLLLRGVSGLRPGAVTHAPVERQPLLPGMAIELDGAIRLVATSDDAVAYRLELRGPDGSTQVLVEHAELHDDTVPALILAGDLDSDGRLDLLLDLSNHYNLSRVTLFLSSSAAPGQILAPVASLQTTGC